MRPTNVSSAAVEDDLVATLGTSNLFQGLDEVQSKLATLHALGDGNILNVSYNTEAAREFAFHENGTDSNELLHDQLPRMEYSPTLSDFFSTKTVVK